MTEVEHTPQVGDIVSSGTLRPTDLFTAMWDALEYYAPERAAQLLLRDDYGLILSILDYQGQAFLDSVVAAHDQTATILDSLIQHLFTELANIAPEGAYFGAHWGDGALFGFWPTEED